MPGRCIYQRILNELFIGRGIKCIEPILPQNKLLDKAFCAKKCKKYC